MSGYVSFNPFDWYWLADDKRVYASARQLIVDDSDIGYTDWVAAGHFASGWPRDDAGNQTDVALQEVLDPLNMFVNLKYYTVYRRWNKEQGGLTLTSGMKIETNDRAQAKINGVRGQVALDSSFTTTWHALDNTLHPMDGAAITAMSDELQAHINSCFETSADVLAQIEAGTITTREQVDTAFGGAVKARRMKLW